MVAQASREHGAALPHRNPMEDKWLPKPPCAQETTKSLPFSQHGSCDPSQPQWKGLQIQSVLTSAQGGGAPDPHHSLFHTPQRVCYNLAFTNNNTLSLRTPSGIIIANTGGYSEAQSGSCMTTRICTLHNSNSSKEQIGSSSGCHSSTPSKWVP